VGCGAGWYLRELEKGNFAVGVDFCKEYLLIAKLRCKSGDLVLADACSARSACGKVFVEQAQRSSLNWFSGVFLGEPVQRGFVEPGQRTSFRKNGFRARWFVRVACCFSIGLLNARASREAVAVKLLLPAGRWLHSTLPVHGKIVLCFEARTRAQRGSQACSERARQDVLRGSRAVAQRLRVLRELLDARFVCKKARFTTYIYANGDCKRV
jgi:hypothetical protein